MQQDKKRMDALEKMTTLFNQKGYRGKFTIDSSAPSLTGYIKHCLEYFLNRYDTGDFTQGDFHMLMTAPYDPAITCNFKMHYDQDSGFSVKQLHVSNLKSQESKVFHIQDNVQLPGSQTLYSLFPKPKPWDRFLKGKFRP